MDIKNRFHTAASFRWVRAENLALLAALVVALALHLRQVRWQLFALMFVAIDVIGYLPGAIAWRRQSHAAPGRIRPLYHHLYNLTHSYLTLGVVVLVWAAVTHALEWAMLALPIHLAGDRGLFGNTYKPCELPFEPVAVPWAGPEARVAMRRMLNATEDSGAVERSATAQLDERMTNEVPRLLEYVDHPSGYLALSAANQHFTVPQLAGFIAYREQGRHLFLFGGVHAPMAARGALLDEFLTLAASRRRGVVGVQVRQAQAELFGTRGFVVNNFGTSYTLRLADFRLGGTARMKLRNKIKRARAAGLRVVEVGSTGDAALSRSAATFARLDGVSAGWLRKKGKKELAFMIGELGEPSHRCRRIFAALDTTGQIQGFITYVPAGGERPGYLHDLTRRAPTAPPGTMELCNADALAQLQREGVPYLHFGFTPFVVDAPEGRYASRGLAWGRRLLGKYGRAIYPAQSQISYKLKWGPQLIEPELLACRPLSLRALIDLLVVTRSI